MNTLKVPERFRPAHTRSVAEAFCSAVQGGLNPDTDRVYIPIFWSNCYHGYCAAQNDPVFRAVPDIQNFLDENLDPDKKYFTVTRCDEGLYENLPDNVLIFGSGDNADIPIPLAVDLPYTPPGKPEYLASFVGSKRSGGPRPSVEKPTFSDYDPDGIGTEIRSKMFETFGGQTDCLLLDQPGGNVKAKETFLNAMRHSRYALCPRGYAPTSFRLYEAMALGAVPVYISDKFCLPYEDCICWHGFSVLCRDDQLSGLPGQLANISEDWRLRAVNKLARLYPKYFSPAGVCKQIARYLEESP